VRFNLVTRAVPGKVSHFEHLPDAARIALTPLDERAQGRVEVRGQEAAALCRSCGEFEGDGWGKVSYFEPFGAIGAHRQEGADVFHVRSACGKIDGPASIIAELPDDARHDARRSGQVIEHEHAWKLSQGPLHDAFERWGAERAGVRGRAEFRLVQTA
jgi:hypothetical protein